MSAPRSVLRRVVPPSWVKVALLCWLAACIVSPARAQTFPSGIAIPARDAGIDDLLRRVVEPSFWSDASTASYTGREYELIRLKEWQGNYVPMVVGQGSYAQDVVVRAMFEEQESLKANELVTVLALGRGTDPVTGAEYRDYWYLLDLKLMYAESGQRVYKRKDGARDVLWFETLQPDYVSPERWTAYTAAIEGRKQTVRFRSLFGSLVSVEENFGVIVVEPGDAGKSRVHFVSCTVFGEDAGWIAQWSSQLPIVIKSTIKSGMSALWALTAKFA